MTQALPAFQIFECTNPACLLRVPSNLSIDSFENCPLCSSSMHAVSEPFTNHQPILATTPQIQLDLILDNLRSTLNVGSIFRTADGAGIRHIYCCGTSPTPAHPKVRKSSLGAEEHTAWSYHTNAFKLVNNLKSQGMRLIALENTEKSTSLFELSPFLDAHLYYAIVIGNEISGIDPSILAFADKIVHIPMVGSKTSLNAAVSAGISIYHLLHARCEKR